MAGRIRLGGTIAVFDTGSTAVIGDVKSIVGIDVGEVTYETSTNPSPEGATQVYRTQLAPIIVTFRTREIDMSLVKLKWRTGVDIIYRANLQELTAVGTVPSNLTTHVREVLNCRGTFTAVNTPDTDFGTVPVTTVTMSCTQYLRGTISYSRNPTTGVLSGGDNVDVGEFANLDHGLHIVGGTVVRAEVDAPMTRDAYATDADRVATAATDDKYGLLGAQIVADYDAITTLDPA